MIRCACKMGKLKGRAYLKTAGTERAILSKERAKE
jgi:hypothetical protein